MFARRMCRFRPIVSIDNTTTCAAVDLSFGAALCCQAGAEAAFVTTAAAFFRMRPSEVLAPKPVQATAAAAAAPTATTEGSEGALSKGGAGEGPAAAAPGKRIAFLTSIEALAILFSFLLCAVKSSCFRTVIGRGFFRQGALNLFTRLRSARARAPALERAIVWCAIVAPSLWRGRGIASARAAESRLAP